MTLPKRLTTAFSALLALAGCINDGTVADQHAITFEKPLPAVHPSRASIETAVRLWHAESFYDAPSIRDKGIGPVRYAALLIPFPKKDFFVCTRLTAKNRFGTYTPPQTWLLLLRDYGQGLRVGLDKAPGTGEYDQYCARQDHGGQS